MELERGDLSLHSTSLLDWPGLRARPLFLPDPPKTL